MNKHLPQQIIQPILKLFILILVLIPNLLLAQLPAGFADTEFSGGYNQAVGLTFDANGRMYVWEKQGKVWIVENGVRLPNPLLDISEEVGNWRDFGFLGFALDPNFLTNGRIYGLYLVDRHHLMNFGTGSYNSSTNEYFNATIGRITRYTATAASGFTQVDYNSRQVLFGTSPNDGFPNLHQSHGIGQLVFGTDGTLLASMGDGASYSSVDQGSASETYYQQAITDGIISSAENIGAYRSQLLDNYAGKVLRIDPETGAGIPSNPYYQSANPFSRRSKVWARGLRNPCRFVLKPETGSHNPADGNPGVFYIGDVGWGTSEELNVMDQAGLNFGWPKHEGMTHQPGYNNSTYAPATHELAKVDWRNGTPRAHVNGNIVNIGSTTVPGPSFNGNCSIGGVWYTGTDFPPEFRNVYLQADYGGDWIKAMFFNSNNECTEVKNFKDGANAIVFVGTSPTTGGVYYLAGAAGSSNNITNAVRKIEFTGGNLPPVAVASADQLFGTSPLDVQFKGSQSYDPNGDQLTYAWNFGDGSTSTEQNPTHSFTGGGGSPISFNVSLTVSDGSFTDQEQLTISLNNTPPVIQSVSIDNVNTFSPTTGANLNLSAVVSDAEHSNASLSYLWISELHHNEHFHQEPPVNSPTSTVELSPVGCDEATYWYRIRLIVTDPQGLFSTYEKNIYPNCSGQSQTISFAAIPDKLAFDPDFNVNPSSTSGLPVTIHIVSGPASVSGNTISLSGDPGEVIVRAIQSGNATYAPAIAIEHSFQVKRDYGGLGLTGNYYNNTNFTAHVLERVDPVINFNWGTSPAAPGLGTNTYSIRWEGEIKAGYSENYTFTTTTDDGVRLWVNNQLIIDQWILQVASHTGNINLTKGQAVAIKMEYYENAGAAQAKLEWQSASQSKEIIPQGFLFPNQMQDQTISFNAIPNKETTDAPFAISATASSGLPVSFAILSGPATISGNTITLTGTAGTVTVRASQSGNGQYNPAPNVDRSFNVTEATGNCSVTSNLALNKTATQSSVVFGAAASRAVDGNTNGDFLANSVSATDNQLNAWWEVDLGEVFQIETINMWNRTDNRQDRLSNYYVFVSDVPFSSTNLNSTINQTGVSNYFQSAQAGSPTPVTVGRTGRYVRVQLNYAEHLTIAEVEVMGCSAGNDTTPPDVTLSTPNANVTGTFPVTASFSETIAGLTLNDFTVTNGTASNLNGSGSNYTLSITPIAEGQVTVRLPANKVTDAAGNGNTISNLLSVNYTDNGGGENCTTTSNLALNKTATQSSVVFAASADKAVDGNTNGDFLSGSVIATDNELNAWWEVDLGDVYRIEEINMWNRTDNRQDRLSNYYVLVSDVPFSSNNLNTVLAQSGVSNYYQSAQAGTPSVVTVGRTGRYVRVQLNYAEHLTIAEVEVMGCNAGADITPPTVVLSTASNIVNGPFVVNADFSEAITGFALNDITVTNGTKSGLSGSGANYSFTITPTVDGQVTASIAAGRVVDAANNPNTASNTLNVTYDSNATCSNVTNGGTIGSDESNCGPFDPQIMTNITLPSGGSGALQYQWQYSFTSANGPWSDFAGASSASLDVGNSTTTAWYRRTARRAGCTPYDGISNIVIKEVQVNCGGAYCSSVSEFPWHDWVAGVKLGTIDNTSNKNPYSDFTNISTTLNAGQNYNIDLTAGFSYDTYDEYWRVWIDLNQDNDFDDAGEMLFEDILIGGAFGIGTQTISGSINIPATATNGNTRMRVTMSRGAYASSCGAVSFGEVEDYTVNITGAAAATNARALFYFSANKENQTVQLEWATNTEIQNDYFIIERSEDGENYEEIGKLDSKFDINTQPISYQFEDASPKNGDNYYRIRKLHHNGTELLSEFRKITFDQDIEAVSYFPNPTSGELWLNLKPFQGKSATMTLYNSLGQQKEKTVIGQVPDFPMLINLSQYQNGIFYITIKVEGKRQFTRKVVLNRMY